MTQGLVHLYWGEGKGKTTAAMGLALRALGAGLRVTVVQFLKDGTSAELEPLRRLGAAVYTVRGRVKFTFQMTEAEKAEIRARHTRLLAGALAAPCDVLVLDEACAAAQLDLVDGVLLREAVLGRPSGREVVLTGRSPASWMVRAAGYSTEMRCHCHPYAQGVPARPGIEF